MTVCCNERANILSLGEIERVNILPLSEIERLEKKISYKNPSHERKKRNLGVYGMP